ncbi:hypothetical protein RKD41_002096 [Streptomyces tendae]
MDRDGVRRLTHRAPGRCARSPGAATRSRLPREPRHARVGRV